MLDLREVIFKALHSYPPERDSSIRDLTEYLAGELASLVDVDAAAMRIARAWAMQKAGHTIPNDTNLDDLEDPKFLRELARAALSN